MPRVRLDGGVIGVTNNPTSSGAGGMWSFVEHSKYQRSAGWPAASAPAGSINAIALLVAGGGGGGGWSAGVYNGGGGGAGGLYYNSTLPLITVAGNYTITIGAGGTGGAGIQGANGSNSSITGTTNLTVIGGGAGGGSGNGFAGGSGGGGGGPTGTTTAGATIQNSTFGYGLGNAGGAGLGSFAGGGGGGSANAGGTGATTAFGGVGTGYNFANGTLVYYAGGGSGGSSATAANLGGGGASGNPAGSGTASTGGGGGGAIGGTNGGNGGSGVAIISYPLPQQFSGGIVTNLNSTNVVHTFTSSGSLNALGYSIDTYFPQTTLLLHGDGTNGANNTVFLENSGANTYIPFDGTYSNYFDGSSKLVATVTAPGTGSVTYEAWFRYASGSGGCVINSRSGNSADGVDIGPGANRQIVVTYLNVVLFSGATNQLSYDTWYHVAVVRNGTTNWTVYLNGTSIGTFTSSNNLTSTYLSIAQNNPTNASSPFTGYISNVRVTNSAVYTSNFTPSTVPLTSSTSPQLLTCQSPIIVDNSTNNRTITITGNPSISSGSFGVLTNGKPQQGTFSPFSQTGWSNYFNGTTGNYLTTSGSSLLGTNFTIEFFLFTDAFTSSDTNYQNLLGINNTVSTTGNFIFLQNYNGSGFAGGSLTFFHQNVNKFVVPAGTFKTGQWQHVALVRNGGTSLTMYLNGVSVGSATISAADQYGASNAGFIIGSQNDFTGRTLSGYISNLRVLNGTVLYTSNFIPPINQFTSSDANTILLTANTNRFIGANSTVSNVSITVAGTPQVQPFSRFSPSSAYSNTVIGGSILFNGSTDYLSGTADPFGALTGDFTVEFWVYKNDAWSTSSQMIFDAGASTSMGVWVNTTAGTLRMSRSGVDAPIEYSYSTLSPKQWYHIVFVRSGTTLSMYINGTRVNSVLSSASFAAGTTFNIGRNTSASQYLNGYISNFRAVKGSAVYDPTLTTLTVPTAPLTAVANTSLLLNATNAGIIDQTAKNNITTYGSAAISSTQSKFGGTSMYFNGTTDYIQGTVTAPGTGDFTMEGWIYITAFNAGSPNIFSIVNSGSATGFQVYVTSGGFGVRANATTIISLSGSSALNSWIHVALVRYSGTINLYINGSSIASTSTSYTFSDTQFNAGYSPIGQYFSGYIDDIRYTRGYARYTTNFTPPTSAFLDR